MLYEEGLPYLWGLWHLTAFILKPLFNLWKIMYCQRFCLLLLIILISSKTSLHGFLRFNSDTPAAAWEVANALSPDDVEHQDIHLWGSEVQLLSHHQREAYYTIFYWEDEKRCVCVRGHSCLVVSSWDPMDCNQPGFSAHRIIPGENTGVGCHFLLQGIFLTQGSNPHLLHFLHWQMDPLPLAPPGKPVQKGKWSL